MSAPAWEDTTDVSVPAKGAPHFEDTQPMERADAEHPLTASLYNNDTDRMKAGFGDAPGIAAAHLLKPGFGQGPVLRTQRNSSGDIVSQGQDGTFYKDGFQDNPKDDKITNGLGRIQSFLARNVGNAPGVAGLMGAGALGTSFAGPAGGMAAGGAGSMTGEEVRQLIGQTLGVNSGQNNTQDLQAEGLNGLASEVGGQAINALARPVMPYVARGAAKVMSGLSGVDADKALRTLMRRGAVFNPIDDTQLLGKMGGIEQAGSAATEGKLIQNARTQYRANPVQVNTEPLLNEQDAATRLALPNPSVGGQLTPEEYAAYRKEYQSRMTSTQMSDEPLPGAMASKGVYTPGEVTPPVMASPLKPAMGLSPGFQETKPVVIQKGSQAPPVLTGYQNTMPSQDAAQLSQYADDLQRGVVSAGAYKGGASSDRDTSLRQTLLGRIKAALHAGAPEYSAADARYRNFADQNSLLKGLTTPAAQQSTVEQLIKSPIKDNMRDAAAAVIPSTNQKIMDLAAKREWGNPANKPFANGLNLSARDVVRLGLVAGGAGSSFLAHDPTAAAPWLGMAALTSPTIQYHLLREGMPLLKQLPAAALKSKFNPFTQEEK